MVFFETQFPCAQTPPHLIGPTKHAATLEKAPNNWQPVISCSSGLRWLTASPMTFTLHWTWCHSMTLSTAMHCSNLNREPDRCSNQSHGGRTCKAKIQSLSQCLEHLGCNISKHIEIKGTMDEWSFAVPKATIEDIPWYSQCPSQSQPMQFLLTSSPTFSACSQAQFQAIAPQKRWVQASCSESCLRQAAAVPRSRPYRLYRYVYYIYILCI